MSNSKTIDKLKYNKAVSKAKETFLEIFDYKEYYNYLERHFEDAETFSRDEAEERCREYSTWGEMEMNVFLNKYALRNEDGEYLECTPEDMHGRLANSLAWVDFQYFIHQNPDVPQEEKMDYFTDRLRLYFDAFDKFEKIIPQGSPMAGMGNPFQVLSLSNCFVYTNDADSYGGIMDIDQKMAQLMKRRGGVGTDITHLRPSGATVKNAARTSTGATSFMHRYSNTTREVAQAGRRGALILTIDITHPEAEEFIKIKRDQTSVTGANISLRITDEFMEAVRDNKTFTHRWPVDVPEEEADFVSEVDATAVWDEFVESAWSNAEPGALFWDNIINESLPDCYADYGFRTQSTNPCGEIPLNSGDSCRLTVINLFGFVKNPFSEDAYFDWDEFDEYVQLGQHIMDNIVDLELIGVSKIMEKIENDPEPEHIKRPELELWQQIFNNGLLGRRTGLGITAMGDTLAGLGLRYGSEEGNAKIDEIMRNMKHSVLESSLTLVDERGTFPIWDADKEAENPFLLRVKDEDNELYDRLQSKGRRNISETTIAPAGSVSMMAQTTSGIENIFKPVYYRMVKVNPEDEGVRVDYKDDVGDSWMEYPQFHYRFRQFLNVNGLTDNEIDNLSKEEINEWVENSPYHGATVEDVDWVNKVKGQALAQKHISHSISVTTNLPEDIPKEVVGDIYMAAWESGCKGCTVYREGSRSGVINSESKSEENTDPADPENFGDHDAPKRPDSLECDVFHFHNQGEKWVAFVGMMNGRPYEIFTGREDEVDVPATADSGHIKKVRLEDGSSRYDYHYTHYNKDKVSEGLSNVFDPEYWNYAKLVSGLMRHGMGIQYVVDVLEDLKLENESITSWKTGVIRMLRKYIEDGTEVSVSGDEPICNCDTIEESNIVYQDGCKTCLSCGDAKCG